MLLKSIDAEILNKCPEAKFSNVLKQKKLNLIQKWKSLTVENPFMQLSKFKDEGRKMESQKNFNIDKTYIKFNICSL